MVQLSPTQAVGLGPVVAHRDQAIVERPEALRQLSSWNPSMTEWGINGRYRRCVYMEVRRSARVVLVEA